MAKYEIMPLSWHQENLKNVRMHLGSKEKELSQLIDEVKRIKENVSERTSIIQIAEIRGMKELPINQNLKQFFAMCKRIDAKREGKA